MVYHVNMCFGSCTSLRRPVKIPLGGLWKVPVCVAQVPCAQRTLRYISTVYYPSYGGAYAKPKRQMDTPPSPTNQISYVSPSTNIIQELEFV